MNRTETEECVKLALEGWRKPALEDRYGVSHSVVERAGMAWAYAMSGADVRVFTDADVAAQVRQGGLSWGRIATSYGPRSVDDAEPLHSERACRKAWERASGTASEGLRVAGKGGAQYQHDARLYAGALARTGTALPVEGKRDADVRGRAAERAVLMTQSLAELRQMADDLGVSHTKLSKAQLAADLVERVAAE